MCMAAWYVHDCVYCSGISAFTFTLARERKRETEPLFRITNSIYLIVCHFRFCLFLFFLFFFFVAAKIFIFIFLLLLENNMWNCILLYFCPIAAHEPNHYSFTHSLIRSLCCMYGVCLYAVVCNATKRETKYMLSCTKSPLYPPMYKMYTTKYANARCSSV